MLTSGRTEGALLGPLATLASMLGIVLIYAVAWPHLPARVPVHAGPGGEADRFLPAPLALATAMAVCAPVGLVFWVLPRLDPRLRRGRARLFVQMTWAATLGVVLCAQAALLMPGSGGRVDSTPVIAALGVLLMVAGNFLPVLPPSSLAGIRAPWTRSSEAVWHRTHRFGGPASPSWSA